MTKRQAKKYSIQIWTYLAETGSQNKIDALTATNLLKKDFRHMCPLCSLYIQKDCKGCPLGNCFDGRSLYEKWNFTYSEADRKKYALLILEKIKAWKVGLI